MTASNTDTLNVAIRHSPAFAVARLTLAPGQRVRAASGALYMRDAAITVEAKMEGGFKSAFKRALGGQSFFTSTFVGDPSRGDLGGPDPRASGDVTSIPVSAEKGLVLTQGNWLRPRPTSNWTSSGVASRACSAAIG